VFDRGAPGKLKFFRLSGFAHWSFRAGKEVKLMAKRAKKKATKKKATKKKAAKKKKK